MLAYFLRPGRWAGALGLALLGLRAAAQAPPGWALKLTPQHLVLSGWWLEAERPRTGHPRQTFVLGPQLYWGPAGRPDVPFDPADINRDRTVRGGGLLGQHRFYRGPKTLPGSAQPLGFYLGYGLQVQAFRLNFARQWREEIGPDGLPYLVFGPVPLPYRETVLRYGATAQAGYQFACTKRVLVDVYAGLGWRKSLFWSGFSESQFRSGPSDYAHRGLYFPAGFKVGVAL
ncbi:MAG: hypothetical protein EOO59_00875 [Hymenobacter sp.]|nr:MAG: hypothetical protein EOO59_00875 [Hymenobacter sp.]